METSASDLNKSPAASNSKFQQLPQNTEGVVPIHLIYYNQEESKQWRVDCAEKFRVSEEAK